MAARKRPVVGRIENPIPLRWSCPFCDWATGVQPDSVALRGAILEHRCPNYHPLGEAAL